MNSIKHIRCIFIVKLSKFNMVVKRTNEEQRMKDELDKSDQFKLDIASARLTLDINKIKTQIYTIESIKTKSPTAETAVRVFGIDGVGGVTSGKVCVQIDGNKAAVWIEEDLYAQLPGRVKGGFSHPDELSKIPELRDYSPIFKALLNCEFSITSVTSVANVREIGKRLEQQYAVISESHRLLEEHGAQFIKDAITRYESNRLRPPKTPAEKAVAELFLIKFENVLSENELKEKLYEMGTNPVSRVLEFSSGRKIGVNGLDGIGVINADSIVVQIDKNDAKVFVEDAAYRLMIKRKLLDDKEMSAQDAFGRILKNPELLGDDLHHFIPIFKALSELGIQIVEFGKKSAEGLQELAMLLVEQNWIASQYKQIALEHRGDEQPEILKEIIQDKIVEPVGDPKKVNAAFARHGIKEKVAEVAVLPESWEILELETQPKLSPVELARISENIEMTKKSMVDIKVGGVEIVGFGNVIVINLHEDVVINAVITGKSTVIIDEDLLSSAVNYAKQKTEFLMFQNAEVEDDEKVFSHIELLEGNEKFVELVSAVRALRERGVENFEIKTSGHDSGYYLKRARELCIPSSMFIESLKSGKNLGETLKTIQTSVNTEEIIEGLNKTGFQKEAEDVLAYIEKAKISKVKLNRMIDEWVEEKAVPSKGELLECAESVNMTQKEFEKALESMVSEMKESNKRSENSIEFYKTKLEDAQLSSDDFTRTFKEYIAESNKSIAANNAKIEKAEEALKILRGE